MNLDLKNIEDYTKDLFWVLKALEQLEKEFQSETWHFQKPNRPESAFYEIASQLHPRLTDLLHHKGSEYIKHYLYQIDLSEYQVKKAVALTENEDFAQVLANLILKRCLQKVLIRNYYKAQEKVSSGKGLKNKIS